MYTSNSCWSLFKCCLFRPMIELLKVTRATWPLWYTDGLSQTMPRQTDVFQQRFSRQQAMLVLSKRKRRSLIYGACLAKLFIVKSICASQAFQGKRSLRDPMRAGEITLNSGCSSVFHCGTKSFITLSRHFIPWQTVAMRVYTLTHTGTH